MHIRGKMSKHNKLINALPIRVDLNFSHGHCTLSYVHKSDKYLKREDLQQCFLITLSPIPSIFHISHQSTREKYWNLIQSKKPAWKKFLKRKYEIRSLPLTFVALFKKPITELHFTGNQRRNLLQKSWKNWRKIDHAKFWFHWGNNYLTVSCMVEICSYYRTLEGIIVRTPCTFIIYAM